MTHQCSEGYIPIFYILFRECAYDSYDSSSLILGYISIICWINVLFPQIWENYCRKSVESLSIGFLATWFLGDFTNFVGAVLTDQEPFQIYLAAYFIVMDLATVIQCIYYNYIYRGPALEPSGDELKRLLTSPIRNLKRTITYLGFFGMVSWLLLNLEILNLSGPITFNELNFSTIDSPDKRPDAHRWIGIVFAWVCAVFYLGSRLPQIMKNFQRKSVQGLSIYLFRFAFLGNLTYSLSIITKHYHNVDRLYSALPFLIGAAGTMGSDLVLFYQFRLYSEDSNILYAPVENGIHRENLNLEDNNYGTKSTEPVQINQGQNSNFYSMDSESFNPFSTATPIQLLVHNSSTQHLHQA